MRHRADAKLVALLEAATAVEIKANEAPITIVRAQETDLPASAKIMYVSGNDDYRQAAVEARRLTGVSGRVAQAELPIVLDPEAAGAIADSWLFEAWSSRERVSLGLPPSLIAVEPGDAIEVITGGRRRLVRVTEVADHGARQIEGRALDRRVYGAAPQPDRTLKAPPPFASGQPLVRLIDLPLLTGNEPASAGYLAAAQSPWPGPLAIYQSAEATGYTLAGIAAVSSTIGSLIDALPAAVEGRIDGGPGVRLALPVSASLASVTTTKMLSGANAAVILSDSGLWEVVQFERAELLSPGMFRISRLLRGQAGTEPGPVAAGAPFVLLDAALVRLDLTSDQVALPLNWRVGPASRDLGSDTYIALTHAFRGIGARPLSPVHIVGRRVGDDLHISFVRRTRSGGDNWEAAEVPLAEDTEAYEIDILSSGGVVRAIATPTTTAVYTAAQQIADFGAPQASVTVRVCQLSSSWGRGATRVATISQSCNNWSAAMALPAWMDAAWSELGQREREGSTDNPRITAFYRDVGHGEAVHDEVAWCAAFVGACLERAGIASTRSLLARSYLDWGEAHANDAMPGAIAVFSRGNDPTKGHVAFHLDSDAAHVYVLGGNQSDAVTVTAIARDRLLSLRWPSQPAAVSR